MGIISKMQYRWVLIGVVCVLFACGDGREQGDGVARIAVPDVTAVPSEALVYASSETLPASIEQGTPTVDAVESRNVNKSDEEIVTDFSSCMREQGWDIPDPELNADGTINLRAMLSKVWQTPGFGANNANTRESLNACLPILQNIGFAGQRTTENEIELEDNLLEFAACLRNKGLAVPDPDFSLGGRAAMRPLIQELDLDNPEIQEHLAFCREEAFGGQSVRRAGGNGRGTMR